MNNVRLVKPIPKRRLRLVSGNGSNFPVVGDLGESDHCYTGTWGPMVLVYFTKRDGSARWEAEAYLSEIASVIASRVDVRELYDADALYRSGEFPWTIFAYPTALADDQRLPPDIDVQMLIAELQSRGIPISIWTNDTSPNTTYIVCRINDRCRVDRTINELEIAGIIEPGFLAQRSEELLSYRADT